jgi:hypothetical protein
MATAVFVSFLIIAFFIQQIIPFYIPGVAPLDFKKGENVEVKVNDKFDLFFILLNPPNISSGC